ncbi:MAG: LLM class flavin-dependent oxidoreductase [Ilumatobacteraceae bacterium]
MAQRPFRFGVHIGPAEAPGDIVAMARRAEELGYEMFVADDSPRHGWGVWSVLAAAAVATRRAELVAMTTGGHADRDARDAKELATLQLLSGGRARLGCGGPAIFSDCGGLAPGRQISGPPSIGSTA